MNTETKSETYEEYTARREREIFEDQIAASTARKARNNEVMRAKYSRFGVMQPMPRSQSELEDIAKNEQEILGADVRSNVQNNVKADSGAEILENTEQSIGDGVINKTQADSEVRQVGQDDWQTKIEAWLTLDCSASTAEILTDCLGVDDASKVGQMAVCNIMKSLGYTKVRESRNGVRDYFWRKAG